MREIIFDAEKTLDEALFVSYGAVALKKRLEDGGTLTVEFAGAGEPLGLLVAIRGQPTPLLAVAQKDSVVLRMPIAAFREFAKAFPAVIDELLDVVISRFQCSQQRIASLVKADARSRMIAVLKMIQERQEVLMGSGGEYSFTRRDLGELTGITTETAIRLTNQLEAEGMLKFPSRGKMLIVDDLTGSS